MAFYNDDQLLSYFEYAMNDVANKEKKHILQDIKDQYLKEMTKVKESLQVKQQLEKSRALREVNVHFQDQINLIGLTYDKQLMEERKKLTSSIFDTVLIQLESFVTTKTYIESMSKKLSAILDTHTSMHFICHLNPNDKHLHAYFITLNHDRITIQGDSRIKIGGFIVVIPTLNIEYDYSYDTLLEEQKVWFIQHTKLFVRT